MDSFVYTQVNGKYVNALPIRVKYFKKELTRIEKITKGDWIDLRAAKEITLKAGEFLMIPLGVAIELPEGHEAIVAPRSSLFKKHGVLVANSIGIIDESYKGDGDQWHLPVYATRECTIPFDERICQFRILKHQPPLAFEEVERLGNEDRGGFGSTGRM